MQFFFFFAFVNMYLSKVFKANRVCWNLCISLCNMSLKKIIALFENYIIKTSYLRKLENWKWYFLLVFVCVCLSHPHEEIHTYTHNYISCFFYKAFYYEYFHRSFKSFIVWNHDFESLCNISLHGCIICYQPLISV